MSPFLQESIYGASCKELNIHILKTGAEGSGKMSTSELYLFLKIYFKVNGFNDLLKFELIDNISTVLVKD